MNGNLFRTGSHGGRSRAQRALVLTLTVAGVVLLCASAGTASRTATPPPPTKKQLHDASAKLVADARKIGTLNFYTSADQVTAQTLADAFGKKYGIKATFTRLTSGPIAARYTAEAQSGNTAADAVMIADAPFFANALGQKWMMPMNSTTVPNVPAGSATRIAIWMSAGSSSLTANQTCRMASALPQHPPLAARGWTHAPGCRRRDHLASVRHACRAVSDPSPTAPYRGLVASAAGSCRSISTPFHGSSRSPICPTASNTDSPTPRWYGAGTPSTTQASSAVA